MTTHEAQQMIKDAASVYGRDASDLWDRITSELRSPVVAGSYAAYGVIVQISKQVIEAADADADSHEMAQALRGRVVDLASKHGEKSAQVVEASYIWARGETGDVSMDTELNFGKHEGRTIGELFEEDRDYVNWIIKEMKEARPHLVTFLALHEDKRRQDEDHSYTYWRDEDHLLDD